MRIAHFLFGRCNPDSANGIDKSVYYLSHAQAELRHEVAVFSLTGKPPLPIPEVTVKASQPTGHPFTLPKDLFTQLCEWQPDIVHLHSVYTPQNVRVAHSLRSLGIPYVVTPHGGLSPHVLKRHWYLKFPYKVCCELPCLNRAAFVHAIADVEDISHYGVRAPIVAAPNGIDLGLIPKNADRQLLVSRFPQTRGKFVFLFLGRLDPLHKGLDLLFAGFSLARLKDSVVVVVGPDRDGRRGMLENLADNLGIQEQVVFTGPMYGTEKFDCIAGADVFVHTSRWEAGVPFSVLEAAAVAKPCLVTRSADPGGQLTRYLGGMTVQPEAKSIAAGLQRFSELPARELEAMGQYARDMVEREFSWTTSAQILIEAYSTYATRAVYK